GRALGPTLRVAVNPEFMREGSALRDFAGPPLTVVGCGDPGTAAVLRSLYATVEAPFVHTAVRTAEMVKYVSNAFHALKVCFANEIGDVCAALGADAQEAIRLFLMDRKLNVSEAYLRPGFAFGGSCLPKDLRALVYAARAADVSLPLLSAILPSNEGQIRQAVEAVLETRRRRIGVVGLAFKPGTDDLRESPMVTLAETLIHRRGRTRAMKRWKHHVSTYFSERATQWVAFYADAGPRTIITQNLNSRQRFALELVESVIPASSKILDAGCGSGVTAAKLMQRGYTVWGIDLAEPMIRQARELCGTDQFGVGDIEHIPFADNTFDGVVSLGVIEYQESDEQALREI